METYPVIMDLLVFLFFGICPECIYIFVRGCILVHIQMYIIYLFTLCIYKNNIYFSLLGTELCKNHIQTETLKKSLYVYIYIIVYGTIKWINVFSNKNFQYLFIHIKMELFYPLIYFSFHLIYFNILITKIMPFSKYFIKYNYKINRHAIL